MLFNSPTYIFLFLPIVVVVYFLLNRKRLVVAGKAWLVLASLFFYGYWEPRYLLLIIASVLFNFSIGTALNRTEPDVRSGHHATLRRKTLLTIGVTGNLGLLGYFKYADFFIENVNLGLGAGFPMLELVLPLAISFFTFQQIAYLADSYQANTHEYDFLNYCLFVTFFPQLIAGPIVHHREMMPQFMKLRNKIPHWHNAAMGVFVFSIGLFKKVVVADSFAVWATSGFDGDRVLGFLEAWGTSLSYTFQLYYDFSAYSDMAVGAALLFNIRLPINFNSPYKARNIGDFWRRWHITLSNWLRDYVYIPLGGNRAGAKRAYVNLLITFLLGGLWHGAGWTFIVWGTLHGVAVAAHRLWRLAGMRLPALLAWFLTFMFLNVTWVFFRANTFADALRVLRGMAGLDSTSLSSQLAEGLQYMSQWPGSVETLETENILAAMGMFEYIVVFALVAFIMPNTMQMIRFVPYSGKLLFKPRLITAVFVGFMLFYSLVSSIQNAPSEFLYFNF